MGPFLTDLVESAACDIKSNYTDDAPIRLTLYL